MRNNDNKMQEIARLQDNLGAIRKLAGWTAAELGEKIGVTKQTVSNLENKKTPMTLTQYIAIRSVLDYEVRIRMEKDEKDTLLAQVVDTLLNRDDEDITEKERENIQKNVNALSAVVGTGIGTAGALSVANALGFSLLAVPAAMVGFSWLSKILNTEDSKRKLEDASGKKDSPGEKIKNPGEDTDGVGKSTM